MVVGGIVGVVWISGVGLVFGGFYITGGGLVAVGGVCRLLGFFIVFRYQDGVGIPDNMACGRGMQVALYIMYR